MLTIRSLYNYLDEIYDFANAEEWDNSGFLVGDPNEECRGILICLDITPSALQYAVDHGFNVILSHHPFPFASFNRLTEMEPLQSMLRYTVRNNLNILSMHTNLDRHIQGTGFALCKALQVNGIQSSEYIWTAELPGTCSLSEFGNYVSVHLCSPVRIFGNPSCPVKRIGLIPGSGMSEIPKAKELNCDAVVTGDVKHHAALDALSDGICVIDAGHLGTEMPVLSCLKETLQGWKEMLELNIVVDIYLRDPYTCFTPIQEEVE